MRALADDDALALHQQVVGVGHDVPFIGRDRRPDCLARRAGPAPRLRWRSRIPSQTLDRMRFGDDRLVTTTGRQPARYRARRSGETGPIERRSGGGGRSPEHRGAQPDDGGALGDRLREIAAHAHGQLGRPLRAGNPIRRSRRPAASPASGTRPGPPRWSGELRPIVMNPRTVSRAERRDARRAGPARARAATPLLVGSPDTLTWISTSSRRSLGVQPRVQPAAPGQPSPASAGS